MGYGHAVRTRTCTRACLPVLCVLGSLAGRKSSSYESSLESSPSTDDQALSLASAMANCSATPTHTHTHTRKLHLCTHRLMVGKVTSSPLSAADNHGVRKVSSLQLCTCVNLPLLHVCLLASVPSSASTCSSTHLALLVPAFPFSPSPPCPSLLILPLAPPNPPARCSVFLRCLSKGKIDDLIYGRCRRALNPPHRLSPCETFSSERPLFIRGTKKMNRAGVLLFTETSCENGRLALLPRLGGGVMHRSQVKWNENVE